MLFVDYQRAFDSLSRAWIWDELKVTGLPSKFINIINVYIKNMVAKYYFQQRPMESNRTRRYRCRNKKKKI